LPIASKLETQLINCNKLIVKRYLTLIAVTLAITGLGTSQVLAQSGVDTTKKNDSEWISYRDAYKLMVSFEKYGKSKHLIQNRFQIVVKDKTVNLDTLRLSLNSKSSAMNLSLDPLGQTQLPLLKAAYDENAELSLSPKLSQFSYRARISIQTRNDGNYEIADLKLACEQTLNYLQYLDPNSFVGKKCLGVRFGFDKRDNNAVVEVRAGNQLAVNLPLQENTLLWSDSNYSSRVAQFSFNGHGDKGHVLTRTPPMVIIAVIE
jgi:hypothetical protein